MQKEIGGIKRTKKISKRVIVFPVLNIKDRNSILIYLKNPKNTTISCEIRNIINEF